jgi:hypothetical protein
MLARIGWLFAPNTGWDGKHAFAANAIWTTKHIGEGRESMAPAVHRHARTMYLHILDSQI